MVGASKILTVSYGTFSCTLEGFDDSFGTMKAIAEYFRDLAADDRYFGAEPPTPDAEMLQRIAQREIRNRVEAYVGNDGVHLRAEPGNGLPAAAAAPAPQPKPAPAPQPAPVAAQPAPIAEPAPAPVAAPAPVSARVVDEDEVDLGSVAAKLARIRAVVDTARTPEPETTSEPEFAEDQEPAPESLPNFDQDEPEEIEEDVAEAEADDIAAELEDEDEVAFEIEPEGEVELEDVAELEEDADEDEDQDQIETDLAEDEDDLDDDQDDEEPTSERDDYEDEDEDDDYDILSAVSGRLSLPDPLETRAAAAAVADQDDTASAPVMPVKPTRPAAGQRAPRNDKDIDALRRERRERRRVEARAEREPQSDDGENRDAAARARARVVKVKRADLEALKPNLHPRAEVDDEDDFDDIALGDDLHTEADVTLDLHLSAEEEADLMAELAEVERDAHPNEKKRKGALARLRAVGLNGDEAAVSRLVNEVNTKMEGPESRRRLSAIAHLKAAVAATMGDRAAKTGADRDAEDEAERSPYRADLARAVRPARKPEEIRKMPPLMLVSEQRIDAHPAAARSSRRQRTGNLALRAVEDDEPVAGNIFFDDDSFADFAERTGARSLPQMLEAAAAYCVSVEGQPSFTRPQVMDIVAEAMGDAAPSREDGLRAFGALLRDGKISKVKRGQFTISQSSRFIQKARG